VTSIGSDLGSTGVVIGVAVLAAIVLAIGRHWRQIGFLACAMTLEFSVFLLATLLVDRMRPQVPRLDVTPPTSSYPSGHTAAAIVLLGCGALLFALLATRSAVAVSEERDGTVDLERRAAALEAA